MLDGELFVCGRLKDVVMVRGVNHYPNDIEAAVGIRGCSSRRRGRVQRRGDREALVVAVEVRSGNTLPDPAAIARAVRAACQVEPDTVVLVPAKAIGKTTSGKTARGPTRERYLNGTLPTLSVYRKPADSLPVSALASLRARIERLLPPGPSGDGRETLADVGVDSLELVELVLDLEHALEQRGAGRWRATSTRG